jgi:Transposase DDE domain
LEFTKEDIAEIYFRRWNVELDLRSIKSVMQMEMLRCKTPELVRKEIWTHILTYNLIRTFMAQAATRHDVHPRSISIKGAIQTLEAFQQLIAFSAEHDAVIRMHLYANLLDAVASHRVANRPGRFEPRQIKRRGKKHPPLIKPRREAKPELLKGVRPK